MGPTSFLRRKEEAGSSVSAHKTSPAAHPESRLKAIPVIALALFCAAAVVAVVAVCARAGTTGKQESTGMPAAGPYEAVDMEAGSSVAAKPEATPLLDEPMGGMADRSLMEPSDIDKSVLEEQRIQELELARTTAALKAAEIAADSASSDAKSENVASKSPQAVAPLPTVEAPKGGSDDFDIPSAASAAVPPHLDAHGAPSMEARPAGASPKPVEEVPKGKACCGPKCGPCGK